MAEQGVQRRLAAILAADVVGYSRMVGLDETGTLARLRQIRHEIVNPVLAEHGGRIFKLMGDGLLAEFPSAVQALRAAIGMQERMRARNEQSSQGGRIEVRIGVHQGDVVVEGRDLLGDGVNIAARLESLAEPGGICVSARVHEDAAGKIAIEAHDMGDQTLKNIARPVRAYRVSVRGSLAARQEPDEGKPALSLPDKPSIAVLPFQNMSGDPEQEYFVDGMVEDITTALSRVRSLFVIACNSSFTYKGGAVDVKRVGRELGVRYVVEGSVRKAGSRIRISSQLVDAESGRHIWAEKYDRELRDIFDIQDEITRAVAASVQTQVDLFEGEVVNRQRIDVWGLLKRAWRRIYDLNIPALEEARQLAEDALLLDPKSARAHAVLSVALYHLGLMRPGIGAHESFVRARDLAAEAVRLDASDEYSHWAYGCACGALMDFDRSIAAFRRALELNPNYSLAHGTLGNAFASIGRTDEAIEAIQVAIRSNPRDPSIFFRYSGLALAYFMAGNFDEAVEWAKKSVGTKSDWHRGHLLLIASLAHGDKLDEARTAVAAYLKVFPDGSLRDLDGTRVKSAVSRESLVQGLRKAGLPE